MGTIDAVVPITNSGLPHSTQRLAAILAFEGLNEAQQHRKESEQLTTLRNLPGVQTQSQFDHFRLGFLLTVYSLVVDIPKHTAGSVALGVAAWRLMLSPYSTRIAS
jgi:hypothetical protein